MIRYILSSKNEQDRAIILMYREGETDDGNAKANSKQDESKLARLFRVLYVKHISYRARHLCGGVRHP